MFLDTMMSTMPVAMIAMEVLWTERFHMLRAVRKSPPERMLNATQMTITAMTIPNRRVSTSAELTADCQRDDGGDDDCGDGDKDDSDAGGSGVAGTLGCTSVIVTPLSHRIPRRPNVPPVRNSRTRGTFTQLLSFRLRS